MASSSSPLRKPPAQDDDPLAHWTPEALAELRQGLEESDAQSERGETISKEELEAWLSERYGL